MDPHNHVYTWILDSGHGWLSVPIEHIEDVGVSVDELSAFSYITKDKQVLFLEEDADAGVFIRAYERKYGQRPATRESYVGSQAYVRKLPHVHST